MLLSKEDRARDPEAWGELLNKLEEVEEEPIPHKQGVKRSKCRSATHGRSRVVLSLVRQGHEVMVAPQAYQV